MKETIKCLAYHTHEPDTLFKQYRKVGKSKSKKVFSKSPEKGGIIPLSKTKQTIISKPGRDVAKAGSSSESRKKNERDEKNIISLDDGDDTDSIDNLNDSFGNPKTRRTVKKYQDQLVINCNLHIFSYIAANDPAFTDAPTKNNPMLSSTQFHGSNLTDSRLEFALYVLDLTNLLPLFKANMIGFYDILLLSKEDLLELKIPMAHRNRILAFSEEYRKSGSEFTIDEINDFFVTNKSFVFAQGKSDEKSTTAASTTPGTFLEKSSGVLATDIKTQERTCAMKIENNEDRIESPQQKSIPLPINQNDLKHQEISSPFQENKKEQKFKFHSTNKSFDIIRFQRRTGKKKSKSKSKRKENIFIKEYNTISNQVGTYFINYKTQKEKSAERINRLKCFIKKSQRSKSKPRDFLEQNILDGKLCGFNSHNMNRMSSMGGGLNYNNYNYNFNSDDLEAEEERNLHEELNKILTRINSASKFPLDQKSIQQLNRIKSMASLGCRQENEGKLKLMDLNVINKEIDKLYEIIQKKNELKGHLNTCNSNIVENKRLLKMLEDEPILLQNEEC